MESATLPISRDRDVGITCSSSRMDDQPTQSGDSKPWILSRKNRQAQWNSCAERKGKADSGCLPGGAMQVEILPGEGVVFTAVGGVNCTYVLEKLHHVLGVYCSTIINQHKLDSKVTKAQHSKSITCSLNPDLFGPGRLPRNHNRQDAVP